MNGLTVLVFALAAVGCVAAAAFFADDPEARQRKEALTESRRRELERKQLDCATAMKLDGTHLYKKRGYRPAAAHLAPAKPQPKVSNVTHLRRAKP
jgi:hypothetical protein